MRTSWELRKYARKYTAFEGQYNSTFGADLRHLLIDHGRSSSLTTNDGIWSGMEADSIKTLQLVLTITSKETATLQVVLCLNMDPNNDHLQRYILVQH
mgnify:CR=1 FL=1